MKIKAFAQFDLLRVLSRCHGSLKDIKNIDIVVSMRF